ncbi:uncharacterized protein LOC132199831 isoform X2 [Neocloeon triangulifer]|uniref:uncharacterized protein LOC132199831 isoform X2 n=1 Tax=Neocloeon triangulifer TaxID=2078957 RepID=UPI00286F47F2|nr:uncharacterized protein LOC132199831 isoform X2 [Neocloeon triangulifer]
MLTKTSTLSLYTMAMAQQIFGVVLILATFTASGGANGGSGLLGATTRLTGDHAADSNCPQSPTGRAGDYVQIDRVTYYVDAASQVNYFDATETCDKMGMRLLRLDTLAKRKLIISTLNETAAFSDKYIWTSGRRGENVYSGVWFWGYNVTLGTRIKKFDWAPDMPFWPAHDYTSCISFLPRLGAWEDHLCEYVQMGFICQPLKH